MELADAIAAYRESFQEQDRDFIYPLERAVDRGDYWYLPNHEPSYCVNGVIIRKRDGRVFDIGSGLNREAAFWAYERGILDGKVDLIVTACLPDLDATVDLLAKSGHPSQQGMRIPGRREKWYALLSKLPAVVFENANLYFHTHELMKAERKGIFRFEIRPCQQDG